MTLKRLTRSEIKVTLSAIFTLTTFCLEVLGQQSNDVHEVIYRGQQGDMFQQNGKVHYKSAGELERLASTPQKLEFDSALRTERFSEASVLFANKSDMRLRELTRLEIHPRKPGSAEPMVQVRSGGIRISSRAKPFSIPVRAGTALADAKGTEYTISHDENSGRTEVSMFDGTVVLSNADGSVEVTNGWQAIAEPGKAPRKVRLNTVKVIQWWIDYPGVIDTEDLILSPQERELLADSLRAYLSGDLNRSLELYPGYPNPPTPSSDGQKTYLVGLLLSVGAIERAEVLLESVGNSSPTTRSLQTLIRAVTPVLDITSPQTPPLSLKHPSATASEWLAESYWHQSTNNLVQALACARRAVKLSPQFGFGWARVGELEFGFGRTARAQEAADRALQYSPRNAQAHAFSGFLLAAQNRIREAIAKFGEAIAIDSGLGNAWLGRGLCKRRLGEPDWLSDIQAAAGLEPGRALFRSYLGKAFAEVDDLFRAEKELNYARVSDPNDPTGWLYSALLKQQQNRVNEAIGDLEKSQRLNDNRALFRSQLLLDQDKAVRSANLASMYRDAGMSDVGRREAARAVTYDYANYSAHLFLSDSFDELRDPTRFNLRHETVWFNELLLANLLAPVGAGRLSQNVTANEYSKLFEADGIGLASQSTWRSDDQFKQLASQYGTYGNTSWALDLDYQHNAGVRPNNELERLDWYTTIKHQLTPQDSVMLLAKFQDYSSGDNFQYYNPAISYRTNFLFEEHQEPILVGGFQHEWSPGVRTLLLGGRLVNEQKFSDPYAPQLLIEQFGPSGSIASVLSSPFDVQLNNKFEIFTAELNQIVQQDKFTVVAGMLWQGGKFDFGNSAVITNGFAPLFPSPASQGDFSEHFERLKAYGYLMVEPVEKFWVMAGITGDHLEFPANFRSVPQSAGNEDRDFVGPKAAFVWSPIEQATLRGIYAQSMGGVSLDESFRLEPTQLAGFPQAFRTVISESVAGSVAAPETEVIGLALDCKFGSRTFGGLQFEVLNSDVDRTIGAFRMTNGIGYNPSSTREILDYKEQSLSVSLNQLLDEGFVLGVNYRLTKAELKSSFPEIPIALLTPRDESALLHQFNAYLLCNHSSGFFARFDARYYRQSNHGYSGMPGDDFVQIDLQAGYRFWRRRAELSVGILNLTDQDYRLNPLTLYAEMPRERVFTVQCNFRF